MGKILKMLMFLIESKSIGQDVIEEDYLVLGVGILEIKIEISQSMFDLIVD